MTARLPLNGYRLLGYVTNRDDHVVVLVDRGCALHDRYVTGRVRTLADPEWYSGNYHDDLRTAALDMVERAYLDRAPLPTGTTR